jgi:hypothetical protein
MIIRIFYLNIFINFNIKLDRSYIIQCFDQYVYVRVL